MPKSALVAQALPKTPKDGMAVKYQDNPILIKALATILIKGIAVFPSPCNTPVVTCCIPKKNTPKLITAIQGPASGMAYNKVEMGVAITHNPTKAGMVMIHAKRIAVCVRLRTVSKSFFIFASEIPGTKLAAKAAVTIVGMLIKEVAIPVK